MGDWKDAIQFRNRAEMLRNLADKSKDDAHKTDLRKIATQYEKAASLLELKLRGQAAPAM